MADGIVDAIDGRAAQRTRYWRTARLDGEFKERAERALWCYENAARLTQRGICTVCADEMPNQQVLERAPIRRAIPGLVERREFDYVRHGTVNVLNFLVVHTGRMETAVVERKDATHYIRELRAFRRRHRRLRGVFLVHNGDPGHTAGDTAAYLDGCGGRWRPRLTPAHASWLNQAELLNRAVAPRYLRRGSWPERQAFVDHVLASAPHGCAGSTCWRSGWTCPLTGSGHGSGPGCCGPPGSSTASGGSISGRRLRPKRSAT
jgi:hypothetical protein